MNYTLILYVSLWGYIFALTTCWHSGINETVLPAMLFVSMAVLLIFLWTLKRRMRIIAMIFLGISFLLGQYRIDQILQDYQMLNPYYLQAEVIATGEISERPKEAIFNNKEYLKFTMALHHLKSTKKSATGKESLAKGNIILYIPKDELEKIRVTHLREANTIVVSGKITSFYYSNLPGQIDSKSRHVANHIVGKIFDAKLLQVKVKNEHWWQRNVIRDDIKASFLKNLTTTEANLLESLLFGADYSTISSDIVKSFADTGLIHILSVSGSHILLLFSVIYGIGKILTISQKKMIIVAIGFVLFYCWLAGFSYPVLRATLTALIATLGVYTGRTYVSVHGLGLVMFGILLWQPLALYDVSFQLSFGAAFDLAIFLVLLTNRFLWQKNFFLTSALLCLCAQIIVLPIQLYYFQQISLVGIFANLLVAPILECLVILGLITTFFHWSVLYFIIHYLIKLALFLNFSIAHFPYATIVMGGNHFIVCIAYFISIVFFYLMLKHILTCKRMVILTSLLCILCTAYIMITRPIGSVTVYSFPKEQVILVTLGNEKILYLDKISSKTSIRFWSDLLHALYSNGHNYVHTIITPITKDKITKKEIEKLATALSSKIIEAGHENQVSIVKKYKDLLFSIVLEDNKSVSFSLGNEDKIFLLVNGQEGKKTLQLSRNKKIFLANGVTNFPLDGRDDIKCQIFWKMPGLILENMETEDKRYQFTFRDEITAIEW